MPNERTSKEVLTSNDPKYREKLERVQSALSSWNATTKRSTLLLETAPTQLMSVGKTVYFVMGSTQVVYKILMD
jgi:hypothetical protein